MTARQKPPEELAREVRALQHQLARLQAAAQGGGPAATDEAVRFRSSLGQSRVVVFTQDRDLVYTWVYNPHHDLSEADIVGKSDRDLLPATDAERLTALKRRVLENGVGEHSSVETTIRGKRVSYDLQVEPLRDADGAIVGVTGVAQDVTERVRTERALTRSERRHRALVHAIPDMLFRIRRDGTFLEYLPGEELTPLMSPDDFLGKKITAVLPTAVAEPSMRFLERAFVTRKPQTYEYPMESDGDVRFYEARIVVSGDDEAVGIVRDVTHRTEAEARMLRRDEQLERLLAAAIRLNSQHELEKVLQEVADSAREVIECRYAALGIVGPSGNTLENFVVSGLTPDEIVCIGDLPTGKGVLGLLMKRRESLRLADLTAHPTSSGFPPNHPPMRSFLGVPVVGREGPIGNLYFTEKIGDRVFTAEDESIAKMLAAEAAVAVQNARLLTELQSLQASRERFYAMTSHEVRNALTAVHGWAELFLRSAGPDPDRPVVETVEAAAYALDLVSDLLDLTRLETAKIEPVLSYAEAGEMAGLAVMVVEPFARQEGVQLHIEPSSTSLVCRTDPKRVQQILINLLRNAVRHSPEGAAVRIEIGSTESELWYSVIDTGEGISPEQQAIIFDAYKRGDSKAGGGTGLGLTLSRSLAQLLGGDVEVRSVPGKGSTFTVRIARDLASPAASVTRD